MFFLACKKKSGMTLLEVLLAIGLLGVSLAFLLSGLSTKLQRIAGAEQTIHDTWLGSARLYQELVFHTDSPEAQQDEDEESLSLDAPDFLSSKTEPSVEITRGHLEVDNRIQTVKVTVTNTRHKPLSLKAYRLDFRTGGQQ